MKTFLTTLVALCFWNLAFSCSFVPASFCESVSQYPDGILVSGTVTGMDMHGADLEVIEVLKGIETRSTIRIWDGTDFDCNGWHSMAAEDWLRLGETVLIILPEIVTIQNGWDQIGDYRLPDVWELNSFLRVEDGLVKGFISGQAWGGNWLTELGYNYFVSKFLQSGDCDFDSPNLKIRFFHDEDENGMKSFREDDLPIGAVTINGTDNYLNAKISGIDLFADEGFYNVSIDESLIPDWAATTQTNFDIEVTFDKDVVLDVGLIPVNSLSNVTTNIVNNRFRCGEEVEFTLVVENEGTVIESGIVWLKIDDDLEDYTMSKEPDYTNADGELGWDYEDLKPYNTYTVAFTITAPLLEDESLLNNIYIFKTYTEAAISTTRSTYCHEVELRCAYDPNDKRAFPLREDNLALIDQPLRYIIRFQNKGNDYARHVVVTDTLDENLDLSTFHLVDSSHPRHLTISSDDGNAFSFEFNNIFLADSMTNEPASHGHITYTIAPKSGLELESEIENTAHIYFDFNPAIVTNTTTSVLVDKFPISKVSDGEVADYNFYPNPASDVVNFGQLADRVRLYDLSGKLMLDKTSVSKMSLDGIQEGLYVLDLKISGKQVRTKIVVSN